MHELLGCSTEGFDGVMLKLTLQSLKRSNTHVTKKAKPMTPAILRLMHQHLNFNQVLDVLFWCASLFVFFLLFRKSNLIPDKQWEFDASKQLRQQDCIMVNGEKVVVGIRWSKNVQFSRELLTFPLPKLHGSVLCPVKTLTQVRQLIPHSPQDHVFKLPDGSSLTYRAFQNKLRQTLIKAGITDSHLYSSHSYRRGRITFGFLCGIPPSVLQVLGNWRSQVFLTYIEFPLETRTAAMEL